MSLRFRFTVTWLVRYSSGPMKQNSASRMTTPRPILACQLRANEARMSRPAGASSVADIAHPRIKHPVGDVGDQAAYDRGHADDQRRAQQDREIVMGSRVVEQQPHALIVENV